jgi:hypothetical protein
MLLWNKVRSRVRGYWVLASSHHALLLIKAWARESTPSRAALKLCGSRTEVSTGLLASTGGALKLLQIPAKSVRMRVATASRRRLSSDCAGAAGDGV